MPFSLPGNLIPRHQELFYENPVFAGVRLPEIKETVPLERRYPRLPEVVIDLAKVIVLFLCTFWQGIYIMEIWFSLRFFLSSWSILSLIHFSLHIWERLSVSSPWIKICLVTVLFILNNFPPEFCKFPPLSYSRHCHRKKNSKDNLIISLCEIWHFLLIIIAMGILEIGKYILISIFYLEISPKLYKTERCIWRV